MGNTAYYSDNYDYEKTGYNIWVTFEKDATCHLACTSVKPAGMTIGKFDISTNANLKTITTLMKSVNGMQAGITLHKQ